MQVKISTLLRRDPERIWQEVQTTRLLRYIAHPLVLFEPIIPKTFPEKWSDERYWVHMKLFGFLPFGKQWIGIRRVAKPDEYEILDDGRGEMIARWRHLITLRKTPEGFTQYTDTVDIEAGWLTLGVWFFANVFFRYRQRRWRRLVARNFDYDEL